MRTTLLGFCAAVLLLMGCQKDTPIINSQELPLLSTQAQSIFNQETQGLKTLEEFTGLTKDALVQLKKGDPTSYLVHLDAFSDAENAFLDAVLQDESGQLLIPFNIINVPEDVPSIQLAVDLASEGDIIFINSGTYSEAIDVDVENIRIIGTGPHTIEGIFFLNASPVVLKGLNIETEFTGNSPIRVSGPDMEINHSRLFDNTITLTDGGGGFSPEGGGPPAAIFNLDEGIVIKGNTIETLEIGIFSGGGKVGNLISGNTITSISDTKGLIGYGILILEPTNFIFNNSISGFETAIYGEAASVSHIMKKNTIFDNDYGIVLDGNNCDIIKNTFSNNSICDLISNGMDNTESQNDSASCIMGF